MSFEIMPISELKNAILPIFEKEFTFTTHQAQSAAFKLNDFLKNCQDDMYVGVEYPYVDKLYRNSYYYYWSSKFKKYHRDCIRLSFFNKNITLPEFFTETPYENIQPIFLGFLVLRPIPTRIIGRNILSPAFYKKTTKFHIAVTNGYAAINGVKLEIDGFPHSSQDTEMMVCAETSLWSIMEYFSHRYADYKPLLPRIIHKILASTSSERQLPSDGLNVGQICYVLKKIGFGVKRHLSTESDFLNMIRIYVESCIPIMAIVRNAKGIVHVMNIIGRTEFSPFCAFSVMERLPKSGAVLYDYYEQPCEYLVVDDNLNPYQKITLSDPTSNYKGLDDRFLGCTISAIIIPLYPKVYIEADKAKTFIINHLKNIDTLLALDSCVIRVFLSSSRSYKSYVAKNPDLSNEIKTVIVGKAMPKFIWIAEIATVDLIPQNKSCGLVLMDATELIKPEVLGTFVKNLYIGVLKGINGIYDLPLPPFRNFNNLKQF